MLKRLKALVRCGEPCKTEWWGGRDEREGKSSAHPTVSMATPSAHSSLTRWKEYLLFLETLPNAKHPSFHQSSTSQVSL